MFTARIQSQQLPERLDAEHFTPEFVSADTLIADASRRLGCLKSLDQLREPSAGLCYGVLQPRFVEHGVPAIEIGDLDTGFLRPPELRISREQHHEYRRSAVVGGDILISVKGTLGVTAIAPDGIEESNVNRDIARLRVRRSEVDPYYLVAFLRGCHGRLSLQRIVRGTIQRNLNIGDLLEHPVLVPDLLAQRFIGAKVRQAERLRERGRRLDAAVRREYRVEIDRLGYIDVPHRKAFRTRLRDRLDPAYYDPAFTSVLDAPWLIRASEPLSHFFSDGSYGDLPDSATYGTGGKWLLRATDLDRCMTHWDAGLRVPVHTVGAKSQVKENDILLEVKGAIEKCVIGRGPAIGKHVNGTVFRFSPNGINAGYLCLHLTAEIKRKYAAREAVNNIIQYLNLDCIRSLPVLRLDVAREDQLGGAFIEAVDARTAATALTSAVTTLVEQLIDGRLAQADVVAAQKALEGGDRSADREILKSLRESEAPDAKPLIADVDALYALLDGLEGQGP